MFWLRNHARIQEFSSGGGGGVQVSLTKKKKKWSISKKPIIFQGPRGGPTFARGGGPTFSRGGGGPIAYSL